MSVTVCEAIFDLLKTEQNCAERFGISAGPWDRDVSAWRQRKRRNILEIFNNVISIVLNTIAWSSTFVVFSLHFLCVTANI